MQLQFMGLKISTIHPVYFRIIHDSRYTPENLPREYYIIQLIAFRSKLLIISIQNIITFQDLYSFAEYIFKKLY
ncbi:MAG: hypothetical protein AMJ60_10245 [Desulfobacterales bacterium SG8_35]|nr:MAG: hypothetical protein AMJ60_10245 [Desulfobacterales bacterium SG8_35]